MWLLLAFLSATLLGFYDVFKKKSLKDNAVLPVLFLNTFFSSLIFLPFILISVYQPDLLGGTIFNVPVAGWELFMRKSWVSHMTMSIYHSRNYPFSFSIYYL